MSTDVPGHLVADIYEAAVADEGLGRIAESIGRFVGVEGAAVMLVRANEPPETYSSPRIREQAHLYTAYYHTLDPWRPRGFVPGRDRVVLANELYPESELIKTEFYADFARPMGMFRPMSAYLDLGGGEMAAFGVEQPFAARLLEAEDKARLQTLLPFVKRALRLRLDEKAVRRTSDVGLGAIDALSIGIVLCRPDGCIIHANPAAQALAGGLYAGAPGQVIRASSAHETDALLGLIRDAGSGPAGSLRLRPDPDQAVVTVATPVPGRSGREGGTHQVMVTFRPETGVPVPNVAVLRSLYRLSPAQVDLCVSLAAGNTLEKSAADRNVAITTARTHLAGILARTETRNLRDLLRLLAVLSGLS